MGLPAFRHFIEHELGLFPHFVLYAILEWALIALLFVEGLVAFVAYEFANIFDLRTPCSLCTRIDHVLVHRKSDFYYNDAMCEDHKKDVSSLAYCHVHGKLSDIRNMCEGCLLSFNNTEAKSSDSEMSKNLECLFDDGLRARLKMPYWVKDDSAGREKGKSGTGYFCSCCGEPMKVKSSTYNKGPNPNAANRVTQAPAPSPRAFAPWKNEEAHNLELPPVKFTELRLPDNVNNMPEDEQLAANTPVPAKEDTKPAAAVPLPTESEEAMDESFKSTPSFAKGGSNKFFAMPTDSAAASPRWASRVPRKSLLDKVELSQDPVEACCGNQADMETILDSLKRQVRLDRKSLIALYMELDEERSASAIAANNAMAMITRLQAEKASVQMEALQYQRMMEEQAEYDQEALQALREMLDKRDEELRELEAEVELYRERYGIATGIVRDIDDDGFEVKSCSAFSERSEHGSPRFSTIGNETDAEHDFSSHRRGSSHHRAMSSKESIELGKILEDKIGCCEFDFERERSFLLGQLRMIESKILHTSSGGHELCDSGCAILEPHCQISQSADKATDNDHIDSEVPASTSIGADSLSDDQKLDSEPQTLSTAEDGATVELGDAISTETEAIQSEVPDKMEPELPDKTEPELPQAAESETYSADEPESHKSSESHKIVESEPHAPSADYASKLSNSNLDEDHKLSASRKITISEEVARLEKQLKALEDDGRFLKHAFLTLEKGGHEGSKLLEEIACHLQRLRGLENMQLISVL